MAYSITQRTQEIGIRVALGAKSSDVLGLVVLQGMGMTVAGWRWAWRSPAAVTRLAAGLLVDISATDPVIFAGGRAVSGGGGARRELPAGAAGDTHRSKHGAPKPVARTRRADFTSRVFPGTAIRDTSFAMASKSRAEIELAQTLTHYPLGPQLLTRTSYGDECFGWRSDTAPCQDCGVTRGQLHIPCCEVEECPNCHTQLVSCDCDLGDACSAD